MLCINVTALVSFSEALLTMSCQQRGSGAASEQSSVSLCCRWAFWAASLMDAAAPHTLQANTGLGLRHLQPLSLQQASSLLLLWGPWALSSLLIFCYMAPPAPLVLSCLVAAVRAMMHPYRASLVQAVSSPQGTEHLPCLPRWQRTCSRPWGFWCLKLQTPEGSFWMPACGKVTAPCCHTPCTASRSGQASPLCY